MPDQPGPTNECPKCGARLPGGEEACPQCAWEMYGPQGRPLTRHGEVTPLGGPAAAPPPPAPGQTWSAAEEQEPLHRRGPVERGPGQDAPGSWGYIKHIAKQDPLFAVVLGLLALDVLVSLSSGFLLFAVISGAVFWGVYTFQDWGYWLALIGAGFGVLMALLSVQTQPGLAMFWGGLFLFVIVVLT